MRKRSLLLAAGACLAAMSLTTGSALADPVPATPDRPLAAVGSDTVQDVMNGYGNGITFSTPAFPTGIVDASGARLVASWDAVGSAQITTHPGCAPINRPNGSGSGITALHNDIVAGTNCVQVARSSNNDSQSSTRNGFNMTYIPYAQDVLTYATAGSTAVPKNLTVPQLTAIYARKSTDAGGCGTRQPLLPQAGSGTRSAWLTLLGLTEATKGDCAKDTLNVSGVPTPLEEHDGSRIKNDPNCGAFGGCLAGQEIMPYSVAQWTAQTTQPTIGDRHGSTILRAMNGISPFDEANHPGLRTMFNVIRTSDIASPNYVRAFGPSSASPAGICAHPEVLKAFGFQPVGNCGDTSIHTN
jgi:ABC-type phosphate transport system substrate-binding protein